MIHQEATKSVTIILDNVLLRGNLRKPDYATGLVVFSHGSGSSRWSVRNNYVAKQLHGKGMATLLFDLLTEQEDSIYENRFDISLLTRRLIGVTQWIDKQKDVAALPLGYFGASTGAASALKAAAHFGNRIRAVVSRGGRPDLAMDDLPQLKAPTLLIIGEWDHMVIGLNKQAYERLSCKRRLEIISQASHLFEEPGKLQEVATLATRWFKKYLN
jgi:dienelactone hydrolase